MSAPIARFTLRDLPLPAKLVITCFLLAVGVGYFTALVQLHFQDSKSGEAMPTVKDVVLKFTGKKWFTTEPEKPVSKFVKLITTSTGPFNGTGTMLPAFFDRCPFYKKALLNAADEGAQLRSNREGDRDALVLWAKTSPDIRQKAYEDDRLAVEADKMPKAITPDFKIDDGAIKVKSLVDARCARCHKKNGEDENAEQFPLDTYTGIDKYLTVPSTAPFKSGGDWVKVEEPIGLEKLTQSTHAHLLSFAMLFSLTGLAFAFTSYPGIVRCILGPLALLAIVTDVAFWWLARLSDTYGVYFAMGVIGTGGTAGAALAAQIVLSIWNMYGAKGKFVLLLLFALGGAIGALLFQNIIAPGLELKRIEREKAEEDAKMKVSIKTILPVAESRFEKLLRFPVKGPDGKELTVAELRFKKDADGGMVRAFFDRDQDKEFAKIMKGKDEDAKKEIVGNRRGELAAFRAWFGAKDSDRKRDYDADRFELPAELAGKPLTDDYKLGDKSVKVRSLIDFRCAWCHQEGGENDYVRLDTYDGLVKHLGTSK